MSSREEMASADGLAALMRSRRSVRRFKDREVAPELLERVVEMASSAPMGIPSWDVGCVIVRGRDQVRNLAAESLGLGSTIIGGAPPILQRNKRLCQRLGVPDKHTPAFALIVGHPAARFKRAVRRHFVHVGSVC